MEFRVQNVEVLSRATCKLIVVVQSNFVSSRVACIPVKLLLCQIMPGSH